MSESGRPVANPYPSDDSPHQYREVEHPRLVEGHYIVGPTASNPLSDHRDLQLAMIKHHE